MYKCHIFPNWRLLVLASTSLALVCWLHRSVGASESTYSSRHTCYEVTPHLHKACHLFLTSELLYWTAQEKGLDYGMSFYNGQEPNQTIYGTIRNLRPHYHLGYRNAIKHEIGNSRWDINLCWTIYHNQVDHRTRLKPGQVFAPFFMNQRDAPLALQGANAHWHLSFNALDLEVGYNCGWKSHFAIRPFAGFKAAKIAQKIRVAYLNVISSFGNPFLNDNYVCREHCTSHNYGLRFGLQSQYTVKGGFKIFFNAAVAAMWGSFDLLHRENPVGFPPRSVNHNSLRRVYPVVELAGGIGWQRFFNERRCYLDLRLGWEEQIWRSQLQIMKEVPPFTFDQVETHQHDLSLLGPTFSATFGF